jgi:glutamate--cysteine ligase
MNTQVLETIHQRFITGFKNGNFQQPEDRRIGAELKFPMVLHDGAVAPENVVPALWKYLEEHGWTPEKDSASDRVIGARIAGEQNDTVASCETGYCKSEFSLAHAGDLNELETAITDLRELLRPFADEQQICFLGYGIQPVTPPGKELLMKKNRTSMWDKVFPSNQVIEPERGDDMHMFTINAASHVHVSVSRSEAIRAVNVLNGFAGPQIALTADSGIWRGRPDARYRCVAEKLWDWWKPAEGRCGVPEHPFKNSRDYIKAIADLKPVYVKRDGRPITLQRYARFIDYYGSDPAIGEDPDGKDIAVHPQPEDIDVHNSCYWFDARVSRYFTVENRVCDQQPPEALMAPAALTLGLVEALNEADEVLKDYWWGDLRTLRNLACLRQQPDSLASQRLDVLSEQMLEVAELGLMRREKGEERFLMPLNQRFHEETCPSIEAEALIREGGIPALVEARKI